MRALATAATAATAAVILGMSLPAHAEEPDDDGATGSIFDLLPAAGAEVQPVDSTGRLTVEVYVEPGTPLGEVQTLVAPYLDVTTTAPEFGVITGSTLPDQVELLRAVPGVRFVVASTPPAVGKVESLTPPAPASGVVAGGTVVSPPACRAVPVEADAPLSAAVHERNSGLMARVSPWASSRIPSMPRRNRPQRRRTMSPWVVSPARRTLAGTGRRSASSATPNPVRTGSATRAALWHSSCTASLPALAILGGQNSDVCLEFSRGLSEACAVDVVLDVSVDGAKSIA